MKRALIIVDCQNDFIDGSLPVPGGEAAALAIADLLRYHQELTDGTDIYDEIVFTADNHRPNSDNGGHISFTPDFVDTWPFHCVAGTKGQDLHKFLLPFAHPLHHKGYPIFTKGWDEPAYSGFQGTHQPYYDKISLNEHLMELDITHVDVCGIAGDKGLCVPSTALDAVKFGYITRILDAPYTAALGGVEAIKESQRLVEEALTRR